MNDILLRRFGEWRRSGTLLRFGQWYMNTYMAAKEPWPELFYEKDNHQAIRIIRADAKRAGLEVSS